MPVAHWSTWGPKAKILDDSREVQDRFRLQLPVHLLNLLGSMEKHRLKYDNEHICVRRVNPFDLLFLSSTQLADTMLFPSVGTS